MFGHAPHIERFTVASARRQQLRSLFVSVPFSGIEAYFHNLETALADSGGFDSTWLYIGWDLVERGSAIPLLSNNWTIRASLACRSRIRSLEAAQGVFDVALFNSIVPLLGLSGFMRRTPTVLTVDATPALLDAYGSWYGHDPGGVERLVSWFGDAMHARRAFRSAKRILAWSPLVRDSLVSDYGVEPGRILVQPPGVDLQRWAGGPHGSLRELRAPSARTGILFVGRDFYRKGGDLLFELACLPEFADCEFHFVTSWHRPPNCPENVHIHNDVLPGSDALIALYQAAHIFALPTRADFYPTNACCEAMAMGLPVITSRVGGMEYLLDGDEGGFAIPPDDPSSLMDRLRALIGNPALCEQFGRRNRRFAETHFDLNATLRFTTNVLAEAARGIPAARQEPVPAGVVGLRV